MARARGIYFNGKKADISIGGAAFEEHMVAFNDAGLDTTSEEFNDLGAGTAPEVLTQTNSGTMTLDVIITEGAGDAYRVLYGHQTAGNTFPVVIVLAKDARTMTFTYTDCVVTGLSGPNGNADTTAPVISSGALRYASMAVS